MAGGIALPSLFGTTLLGLAAGLAGGAVLYLIARVHYRKLFRQMQVAFELAEHSEHERDLAQQELVRRLEEERELAKEKIQFEAQLGDYEKYAALAQLALGAAHEINNPLLGILSHLEWEKKTADAATKEEIDQCIEGAKRISSAVRGLLNYARPGPLLLGRIHLDRLVAETVAFIAHQPMFRAIRLENRVPSDLPPITADSNQISQVLMNLLLNAAQATPPGGTVTVSAEKVKFNELIELRVSDTGAGIPPDILPHVFEPFFTTKRNQGTGLGLSISQAYVRSHSGTIHVESQQNRGTIVRIVLPIRQEGRPVLQDEEVVV
ncbi:histidine kinase [Candidatus Koribacter versatilis Ellin345]|uniref:histidine kinase n=1 Tax=Koribacter versatilis (strain Ellin345) TaxID=204669 RepID=Q1IMW8_KORVE|nr:ATP-binding protein [Candidatus Koribacter versatilis]ABF41782.1 histidine kinase [Candidatus Koribacter versatilis Ellin345]